MPTTDTLDRFIARVEQNAHAEAVEEFYTAGATMQENQSPPRVGRDKHVAAERNVMSRAKSVSSQCVRPVFVNGDPVPCFASNLCRILVPLQSGILHAVARTRGSAT